MTKNEKGILYIHLDMQNTTAEMRECAGCKTIMSLDNLEKNKKGVMFKTCMNFRKNDQGMTK